MYTLLLVDDEPSVLEAIKAAMPWEKYNVQLTGACRNGPEALEEMRRCPPDLVVTDVKMPVMSGIDMIRAALEMGIKAEFIVLSSFDEFEFAKSAMSLGVRYYLLKPCGEEELGDALLKAQKDLERNRQANKVLTARRRFKKDFLGYSLPLLLSQGAGGEVGRLCGQVLEEGDGLYLLVFSCAGQRVDYPAAYRALASPTEDSAVQLAASPFMIGGYLCAVYLCGDEGLGPAEATLLQKRLAGGMAAFPQQRYFAPVTCEALRGALCRVCGNFHTYALLTEEGLVSPGEREGGVQPDIDRTAAALEERLKDPDEAARFLQKELGDEGRLAAMLAVMKLLLKQNESPQMLTPLFNQLYETADNDGLAAALVEQLSGAGKKKESEKPFVEEIVAYIDSHLDDSRLSLKWVANELVFRNEDYVGRAFAAHTGETFNAYLNRKRIERAKFLISTLGTDKLYTVAEQIGLGHNPRYFSRFFRKHTGYSPREYHILTQKGQS